MKIYREITLDLHDGLCKWSFSLIYLLSEKKQTVEARTILHAAERDSFVKTFQIKQITQISS